MYQSEWTKKPVLHLLPHWNWKVGQTVDVWAYYSQADEVELFLNGKSLGIRKKGKDDLHVSWKVPFEPGTLKAVSRKDGKVVLTKEIHTAGKPYKIELLADKKVISKAGKDLSFVTVKVLDKAGNLVPYADILIHFTINDKGKIAGLDNGYQADTSSFQGNQHHIWKGLGSAIIRSSGKAGTITLSASSDGLKPATIDLVSE